MERFLSFFVFLAVGTCLCLAGNPFDFIKFVPFNKIDKARMVVVGTMLNSKAFVARVTLEDGSQIPGTYAGPQDYENQVFFAHLRGDLNETRYIRDGNEFKTEYLQHSVRHGGGVTWEYHYKDVRDDTAIVFGRLSSGEKVYGCRAVSNDRYIDLVLGRYVVGRSGCLIHLRESV